MSRASQNRPGVGVAPSWEADHPGGPVRSESILQPEAPWEASDSILDLPDWVGGWLGENGGECPAGCEHRSVRVENAASMSPSEFESETRRAYRRILEGVAVDRLWRAWNFIPRINDDASESGMARDRYMSFNAGRHHGFFDVHGTGSRYPVASGVGHAGEDLVIHLLHGDDSPRVVNNPRQTRPDHYSHRYGDPPPAFARACLIDLGETDALLVSGTASVVGEASLHEDDFTRQLDETLRNLETVVHRAWPKQGLSVIDDWLVYLPNPRFANQVEDAIRSFTSGLETVVEIRQQPLCRPELLVEIECAAFPPPLRASR